jgi:hypothetical protein
MILFLAGDELKVTRSYKVYLEDTLSGVPPPGRRHFFVELGGKEETVLYR